MRRGSARLYRRLALGIAAGMLAFVSLVRADAPPAQHASPAPFSSMHTGRPVAPWTLVSIGVRKRATRYDLVSDDGAIVLHAVADNAASALAYPMHSALQDAPVVAWRWKIAGAMPGADPHIASREDAPARPVGQVARDAPSAVEGLLATLPLDFALEPHPEQLEQLRHEHHRRHALFA